MAKRPPTDFELLKAIYEHHHDDYLARANETGPVYVPLDIPEIARQLQSDDHTVFGRLYYHLEPQYAEPSREDGGPRKRFFVSRLGEMVNCLNFPLMEAVLAGLWEARDRERRTLWISAASIGISVAALIVSVTL